MKSRCLVSSWRPFSRLALGACLAALVLLLTLAVFVLPLLSCTAGWVLAVDQVWHARMVLTATPAGLAWGALLHVVGGAWITLPVRLLVALGLWVRGCRDRFLLWVLAMVSVEALALLLKGLYGKPRPADGLSAVVNTAFPSGHTASASVMAFGLLMVLLPPGRARLAWFPLALAWPVAMAWSRTVLRDHWLSDTVAGFLLGLAGVLVAGVVVARRTTSHASRTEASANARSASEGRPQPSS